MTDLALRIAAIGAAAAPAVLLLIYVIARDGGRPSAGLIGTALSFGAVASMPAVAFSGFLEASGLFEGVANIYTQGLLGALLSAAMPEEIAKLLMLIFIVERHEDCARLADVFVGSIAVGLGFAVLESSFYIVDSENWNQTAILRAVSATPGHFFFGVLMGVFASGMIDLGSRWKNYAIGLALAILAHTLYDAPLFSLKLLGSWDGHRVTALVSVAFFSLTLIAMSVLALRYLKRLRPAKGWPINARWPLRILMSHYTWCMTGVGLIVSGFALVAVGVLGLFDGGYKNAVFIPFAIVPVAIGGSMLRFGRDLSPRRLLSISAMSAK